jgi:hypothetical protein
MRVRETLATHRRWILRIGWVALGTVAVAGFVITLLGPLTSWAGGSTVHHLQGKERADAVNAVRQTLLQASGGAAALIVLVFTGMTFLLSPKAVMVSLGRSLPLHVSHEKDLMVFGARYESFLVDER